MTLPVARLPHKHGPIRTGGSHPPAVGAEHHVQDLAMSREPEDLLARRRVPHFYETIDAPRDQVLAVRLKASAVMTNGCA